MELTIAACESAIADYLKKDLGLMAESISTEQIDGRLWICFNHLTAEDDPDLEPVPYLRGILWQRPFDGSIPQRLKGVAVISLHGKNPTPVYSKIDQGWSVTKPGPGTRIALVPTRGALEARPVTFNQSDWGETLRWPFDD